MLEPAPSADCSLPNPAQNCYVLWTRDQRLAGRVCGLGNFVPSWLRLRERVGEPAKDWSQARHQSITTTMAEIRRRTLPYTEHFRHAHFPTDAANLHTSKYNLPLCSVRPLTPPPRARYTPGGGRVHRPPEVGDLQLSLQSEQQVLGLDVSVDHLARVAVLERVSHLGDVLRRPAGQRGRERQTGTAGGTYTLLEMRRRPFPGPRRVQKILFSFTNICSRD